MNKQARDGLVQVKVVASISWTPICALSLTSFRPVPSTATGAGDDSSPSLRLSTGISTAWPTSGLPPPKPLSRDLAISALRMRSNGRSFCGLDTTLNYNDSRQGKQVIVLESHHMEKKGSETTRGEVPSVMGRTGTVYLLWRFPDHGVMNMNISNTTIHRVNLQVLKSKGRAEERPGQDQRKKNTHARGPASASLSSR